MDTQENMESNKEVDGDGHETNQDMSHINTQQLFRNIDDCLEDVKPENSQTHLISSENNQSLKQKELGEASQHITTLHSNQSESDNQEQNDEKTSCSSSQVDLTFSDQSVNKSKELFSSDSENKSELSKSVVESVTQANVISENIHKNITVNTNKNLSEETTECKSENKFLPTTKHVEEEEDVRSCKRQKLDTGEQLESERLLESQKLEALNRCEELETAMEDENVPVKEESIPVNEESTEADDAQQGYEIQYDFSKSPGQITGAWTEFENKEQNFLKGCKWSPDGSCILTNSDDNYLRLFNTPSEVYYGNMENVPQMTSILKMKGGETIYDYCWYPLMNSSDPATCCLISSSRCMPVHMWDAFSGELICSYRSYDQADELVAAHSVSFNPDGSKIYCGFNKTIRVFDVSRPGRDCQRRPTFAKSIGQPGIISCIEHSPVDYSLYAAGSYSRTIALYYEPKGELACCFKGQQGGVTHIKFSPDGTKLYSGGRKDPEILCWDLRNPSKILLTMKREVETNQRIYFDLDSSGRYMISGNHNGSINIWDVLDTDTTPQPILSYQAHHDTVNGVSLHPSLPLLATSSGQRHYPALGDSDDSDSEDFTQTTDSVDYSLGLWWLGS
ncbi:hypothetical protein SNE40_000832 [Patella caerulea]|uniref:WD repeat-containing protein 79 n=1 Tax=Patella caerulea TaxID=87958 RepID=A0AAN8Q7H5_PATCE